MKNAASVFFVGFPGVRVSGKQCKCMDTCFFCAPTGAAKMLVGVAPQTRRTSGHRDQRRRYLSSRLMGSRCLSSFSAERSMIS